MRRWVAGLAGLVLVLASVVVVSGEQIADRDTLNSMLGAAGVTEDFESLEVDDGLCMIVPSPLNSATAVGGQGPGLVVDGVSFNLVTTPSALTWCGKNAYTNTSKCLVPGNSPLDIDFTEAVFACGMDFFQTVGSTVDVRIYAPDDTTVLDALPVNTIANTYVFFGYSEGTGIGKVRFGPTGAFDSIAVDSVTFGVPEPTSLVLLGAGAVCLLACARRKRRRR